MISTFNISPRELRMPDHRTQGQKALDILSLQSDAALQGALSLAERAIIEIGNSP